ncbi:MAG: ADP-ribosylglycohydrolase family protein [bacterium]
MNILEADSLHDRAFGCLIGLAIGDSFGDAARKADNHFLYGITTDFRHGVPAPGTDDTEFALLTADTMLQARGELTSDHVLTAWRQHVIALEAMPRGGASEREAAANIRRGILPPVSGQYNSHYMSDGAAMRVAPIGIVCAGNPVRAARLAEIDASISHWRDGIWGAQAVAAGVAAAMAGKSVDDVIAAAMEVLPHDSWLHFSMHEASQIVHASAAWEEAWMPLHDTLRTEYKAVAPEAVASAFAVFKMQNGDFKKSVIWGGNFGRDADTIAAIVGALSGAMQGTSAIPPHWIDKVRYAAGTCLPFTKGMDLKSVARQLAELIDDKWNETKLPAS